MKDKAMNWIIVGTIIVIISGLFYWYEWRPSEVRQNCHKEAKDTETKLDKIDITQVPEKIPEIVNTGSCEIKLEDCSYPKSFSYVSLTETAKFKNCLIKVNKDIYDTCYKECLQKNGL
jgi:preprotein translocase subunit YajC